MNFDFSNEQLQLRASLRAYLRDHYNFDRRRATARSEAGWDPEIWTAFADRLGILSLADPDNLPDPVDTMVVMEELGAALVIEPYLETIVTGAALLRAGQGRRARHLLDGMASGRVRTAIAWAEPETRFSWEPRRTTAARVREGWRITGLKSVVVGAPFASDLLVSAKTERGISVFIVSANVAGVTQQAYPTIDGRRAADITFNDVIVPEDSLLGVDGAALASLEAAADATIAAVGAEAIGLMRRMLEDTIEFTKQRQQFGQPISTFQALQHRMVDMFVQIEMASSAVLLATLRLGASPVERARAASVAKVTIAEACRFVGQNAVQLHGGMGMTDELPIGHYFKRATVIEHELGTVDYHLGRFANADAAVRANPG